jgi:dipeptidyl aminopeptidase/acylaminoacyl peptidase
LELRLPAASTAVGQSGISGILHGEADDRCPIGQAEEMFTALKKAGCEVEFVRYPGSTHSFTHSGLRAHRADALERTLLWGKQHLGEPEPRTGSD